MNEVHGSWFDPSNPVVKYSGSLQPELYQAMARDAQQADLVLVMGTSLSGLTIDGVAHIAGPMGIPRVVFDVGDAPVKSLKQQGGWSPARDCHVQGPLDERILGVVHALGWLEQCFDYLPYLCLGSLQALKQFVQAVALDEGVATAYVAQLEEAIAQEVEREKHFYGEE